MHRFFVAKDQIPIIAGSDVHHIKDVLRMKAGDELELLNGSGRVYSAKIAKISNDEISCEILESRTQNTEHRTQVTLAQCLPKSSKMDFIIQKCTELGVHKIIPMLSERSIVKSAKLERWKRIAKEASEQSSRAVIPEITPLQKFEDVLKTRKQYDLALIPWELEKEKTLKSILISKPIKNLLILIGPEGGFSSKEIKQAASAGFISVSLGQRILRAETAGMAVLAMLMYELE